MRKRPSAAVRAEGSSEASAIGAAAASRTDEVAAPGALVLLASAKIAGWKEPSGPWR
jgi:hypothetical protein